LSVAALIGMLLVPGVPVAAERPRLIVVVSVDQLCQDYLIRFGDNFSNDGVFHRVEREGAAFAQCHHRHAFTVTGPGHAVQLTGHNADAAYWLEDNSNAWTTSTYYRHDLPAYLRMFNEPLCTERFRGKSWELLLPKEKYHNSGPDKNAWENPPKGFTSEFP